MKLGQQCIEQDTIFRTSDNIYLLKDLLQSSRESSITYRTSSCISFIVLGGLSKGSLVLFGGDWVGQVKMGDCGTSILMYNAGSDLRLFQSDFHDQRTGDTFKSVV